MKLNHGVVLAAVVVGSLAVMGCSKADGEDASEGASTEQASVAADEGGSEAVASNEGFTQDARFNRGGARHGERGFRRAAHRGERRGEGFRRGGWERRREHEGARRAWWRFW